MANNIPGGEPSTAPQPDRWYTLRLGSSFKDERSTSRFCTLRYEFKPASIDKGQSGSLHKNKDNRITVEFHNNQPGKPKVTFEGSSEDCKENDGVLFFDGETFRLERLHRAVKRLRHVRQAGESVAASAASASISNTATVGMDSRSPPLGKIARSQPLTKSIAPSVPLEVERIDIGEPQSPASKLAGKTMDKDAYTAPPNISHASPGTKFNDQEENVDIDVDDDDTLPGRSNADGLASVLGLGIDLPNQNDTDDEVADIDISDDDGVKEPAAAEDRVNAEEEQRTSSSSGSSGSGSSGSGSGSSSSDSEGSEDESASSGGDVDIDG